MILDNGLASENQLKGVERNVRREVDEAVIRAERDSEPPIEELFTDITTDEVGSMFIRHINYEDSVFPGGQAL